jgi:hypothetical protein
MPEIKSQKVTPTKVAAKPTLRINPTQGNDAVELNDDSLLHLLGQYRARTFPRVIVGVPFERTVRDKAVHSLLQIASQGWPQMLLDYRRCDMARNQFALEVLGQSEITHLVMLDSDHVHPPNVVSQLVQRVREHPDHLVIGGLNFRRGPKYDPCIFFLDEDGKVAQPTEIPENVLWAHDRMIIGSGSMIIAREVFERMIEADPTRPFFGYDYSDWALNRWPGTDVYFSLRCHELGIRQFCDTSLTSPHLGDLLVDQDTWARTYQNNFAQIAAGQMVEVSTVPTIDDDGANGARAIVERTAALHAAVPDMWKAQDAQTLYVGANKKRFLFGGELAVLGHKLTVLEVWRPYADGLINDERVEHMVLGDVTKLGDAEFPVDEFDFVFWWHGPEHVDKAGVVEAIPELEARVKSGGMIVIGCPWGFFAETPHDGNPHQSHVSTWTPDEFQALGFTTTTAGEKDTVFSSIIAWKKKP